MNDFGNLLGAAFLGAVATLLAQWLLSLWTNYTDGNKAYVSLRRSKAEEAFEQIKLFSSSYLSLIISSEYLLTGRTTIKAFVKTQKETLQTMNDPMLSLAKLEIIIRSNFTSLTPLLEEFISAKMALDKVQEKALLTCEMASPLASPLSVGFPRFEAIKKRFDLAEEELSESLIRIAEAYSAKDAMTLNKSKQPGYALGI